MAMRSKIHEIADRVASHNLCLLFLGAAAWPHLLTAEPRSAPGLSRDERFQPRCSGRSDI